MAGIVPPPPAVLIGDVRAAVQQHVDELVTRQCQGGGDSPLIPRNQEGGTRGPSSVPLAAGIFGPALFAPAETPVASEGRRSEASGVLD